MKFWIALAVLLGQFAFAAPQKSAPKKPAKEEDPRLTFEMAVAEFNDARLPVGTEVTGDWAEIGYAKQGYSKYYEHAKFLDVGALVQHVYRIRQLQDFPPGAARYEITDLKADLDANTELIFDTAKAAAIDNGLQSAMRYPFNAENSGEYECNAIRECRISRDQTKLICQWTVTAKKHCLEYWGASKAYRLFNRR